jgi:hypothetical protein
MDATSRMRHCVLGQSTSIETDVQLSNEKLGRTRSAEGRNYTEKRSRMLELKVFVCRIGAVHLIAKKIEAV